MAATFTVATPKRRKFKQATMFGPVKDRFKQSEAMPLDKRPSEVTQEMRFGALTVTATPPVASTPRLTQLCGSVVIHCEASWFWIH